MNTFEDKSFWLNIEKQLQALLNSYTSLLDEETTTAVQHYIDHSEYEMAFEGIFIEIMNLEEHSQKAHIDVSQYVELGKQLKLDTDSVFDDDFWPKFTKYFSIDT